MERLVETAVVSNRILLEVVNPMRTLRRLQMAWIVGAVVALASPVRAAEVDKYLPENTEVVAVVNAKQILDAPLIKKHFLEQLREHLKGSSELMTVLDSLGFDPFKDLTSITVALPALSSDAKPVIITHGNFDKAKFEAKGEEVAKEKSDILKIHKEGNRKIYEVKHEGPPNFVGLIDATTIVAGPEKQQVLDAFAKADSKAKGTIKKATQELVEKADAKQSIWVAITANAFLKSDVPIDDKAKKALEMLDSITAGLTVEKGVQLRLAVATKSAANAKELAQKLKDGLGEVKGLVALFAEQKKELAPLVDLVGNLQVSTEGNTILVKSDVSEENIEKALKKN